MDNIEQTLKEIKKDFFTYRNGIVSQQLKPFYTDNTIIFGLMAQQFMQLAAKYPKNYEVGKALWEDKNCRESRMFALYLIPPNEMQTSEAIKMVMDVRSSEEAEFLAFKILRNMPEREALLKQLHEMQGIHAMTEYCINMFQKHIEAALLSEKNLGLFK